MFFCVAEVVSRARFTDNARSLHKGALFYATLYLVAEMAESVDAADSKSAAARCPGSSPGLGTSSIHNGFRAIPFFENTPNTYQFGKFWDGFCPFLSQIFPQIPDIFCPVFSHSELRTQTNRAILGEESAAVLT